MRSLNCIWSCIFFQILLYFQNWFYKMWRCHQPSSTVGVHFQNWWELDKLEIHKFISTPCPFYLLLFRMFDCKEFGLSYLQTFLEGLEKARIWWNRCACEEAHGLDGLDQFMVCVQAGGVRKETKRVFCDWLILTGRIG